MTIAEAVQLVLQVSNMAQGAKYFLDMGKPIKILDLAKQMIKLSGLKIKDKSNLNGDIEIIFTGLKYGEKLFEELLIDTEVNLLNIHLFLKDLKISYLLIF